MDQNEDLAIGFGPQEREQLLRAAEAAGKSPAEFVRDAALDAAEDPFPRALANARHSATELASAFAHIDRATHTVTPGPDSPMSSRDLRAASRRAA
ncbi:hypothetical protein ACH4PU_30535 [Streptomyces sp. NPDC021100]|uniref:hypothetical protein n=1 Tax=Streptomyces sp. NPDC021100 TaxID=3365114 RepID=UPI0037A32908